MRRRKKRRKKRRKRRRKRRKKRRETVPPSMYMCNTSVMECMLAVTECVLQSEWGVEWALVLIAVVLLLSSRSM